jgi:methyl-accepting chemotaxis protein
MTLGFGTLLMLTAAILGLAVVNFRETGQLLDRLKNSSLEQFRAAAALQIAANANAARTLELTLSPDRTRQQALREDISANRQLASASIATLQRLATDLQEQEQLRGIAQLRQRYVESFQNADRLISEGRMDAARELVLQQTVPLLGSLIPQIAELEMHRDRETVQQLSLLRAQIRTDIQRIVALGIVALLLGALAMRQITQSVTRPIADAVETAHRVAQGDLTLPARTHSPDEPGQMLQAQEHMARQLAHVVTGVRSNADQVAAASSQIARGNQDLSHRTETQASMLQAAAASLQELSQAATHSAEDAHQACVLTRNAVESAQRSGQTVAQVVERMASLHQSSRRIADINATIDGIALQTRILALNAAVEAARAGESGQGFSVVAREVGMLAQRSAEAAREIKGLVTSSVEQIDGTHSLVASAGKTMEQLVHSIDQVRSLVNDLATVAAGQRDGMADISRAVDQMDAMTQQNAALVEQSAAAASSLSAQATELVRSMSVFQLPQTTFTDQQDSPQLV